MILQHTIVKYYKKQFTIRVNPQHINGYVGSNISKFVNSPNKILNSAKEYFWPSGGVFERFSPFKVYSFVIPDIHYSEPVPINSLKKYDKIRDLIAHKENYKSSIWYKELSGKLEENGSVKHKNITMRSENDLNHFFEDYALRLVNSMKKAGYDENINQDIPNVMIGKNGEIHKSNAGDHRFFVAKITGVSHMPFSVKGVHESFLKTHGIPNNNRSIDKLIQVLRELENSYSENDL